MKNNVDIRCENEQDFNRLHQLVKIAFRTAEVSDGDEQDYLDSLRKGKNYIPELALVAEQGNGLVGQVILTRSFVETQNGRQEVLLLGPVAVKYELRNKGIGGALINDALCRAKGMGFKSVFLLGNPKYYSRFGFEQTSKYGIHHATVSPEFCLCIELQKGALDGISGTVNIV